MYNEKGEVQLSTARKANVCYMKSKNINAAAYVSTEKYVEHRRHAAANMRTIEEMVNEELVMVMKSKDKLNVECKY